MRARDGATPLRTVGDGDTRTHHASTVSAAESKQLLRREMPREDVNDIIQNFVDNDLASLDRIGGQSDSFTLSPLLTKSPPSPAQGEGQTTSKQGPTLRPTHEADASAELASAIPGTRSAEGDSRRDPSGHELSPPIARTNSEAARLEGSTGTTDFAGSSRTSSTSRSRHVSTSSEVSTNTLEREKRASLGDKFKKFGRRITSSSKK